MSSAASDARSVYRRGEVKALCVVCGQDSVQTRCPRCHAPLCGEHAIAGDERCASCEAGLAAFRHHRKINPIGLGLSFAAVALASVAIVVTHRAVDGHGLSRFWILPVALLGGCLPLFIGLVRRWWVHPIFLRETPTARYLRLPPPQLGDESALPPDLALGGFVLTLFLPVPGMPIGGLFLCAWALSVFRRQRARGEAVSRVEWTYAVVGVVVGALTSAVQLVCLWFVLSLPSALW